MIFFVYGNLLDFIKVTKLLYFQRIYDIFDEIKTKHKNNSVIKQMHFKWSR